ncbi:MAG: hypothetical protein DYG98_12280 [Haliscomenobacteraceae bacterium CHB4]|nr:hypothetical protein [Saprospiraceae bacterium]MCE7923827.1 hypothetical protein [Haliscomenobacteraceae bacterium CHB4]
MDMNRLEEIIKTLKTHIGESVEAALEYLEQVLAHDSMRYNDFIQIKSRYNSLQRELLLGVLDHSTYDISRNNISKALLLLAEEITEKDLVPEGGVKAQEEDKRGEVLYHVPDLMQLNHEEKCTVRIAFDIEHLKRDWEETPEDVIKSIRVSEIMAVNLLNVDESDPPFAIRSFSEAVQFVDKDDFTEWIFYVKPLKLGRFPLLLRVSVIEMINNKEYKKDIVLEEEITVQTEEVPPPGEAEFKSAGTTLTVGNAPLPPSEVAPPAAQAQEAAKKGLKGVAGALLTVAALAMAGYFGFQTYQENQNWNQAKQGGKRGDYEEYLKKYPDGRHSSEARGILDSLNMVPDTMPAVSEVGAGEPGGVDTPHEINTDTVLANSSPANPAPGKKTATPAPKKKNTDKKKSGSAVQPQPVNPPAGVVSKDTAKSTPPPLPVAPLLRGNNFYFRIPRFTVLESETQNMFVTFYQFNQYREVLAVLGSLGEAKMTPGTKIAFMPEKGGEITAEVKYVSTTPQVENRSDWYFTLSADELARLANEKFKGVRLLHANGQVFKTYKFSNKGSKNLNRRAGEALKKLDNK